MGAFNLRNQFRGLDSRACECALISQPGFVTILLSGNVLFQFLLLFVSDRFERPIVKCRVKRQPRRVQLLHDGDIQLLLSNQNFDVSAPERWRAQPC